MNAPLPMVRVMFTWNTNRSEGPLYATRAEAVAAEPYWKQDGLELVAVYVAGDDRIVHVEKNPDPEEGAS